MILTYDEHVEYERTFPEGQRLREEQVQELRRIRNTFSEAKGSAADFLTHFSERIFEEYNDALKESSGKSS